MSSFPFGYAGSTAFYLTLYVVTLAIHAMLMSYTLAGSAYVAARALRGGDDDAAASTLRDWLPFSLGATITAGVAPLLFVQVLYQERFYTANLLLFHRWMAIVPVLIAGFYLLYLAKTERVAGWSAPARAAVSGAAFACFAFTAYAWVENHTLALDRDAWVSFYGSGELVYGNAALAPRFAMWLAGAAAVMCAGVAVQLAVARAEVTAATARRVAAIALAGLAAGGALALVYVRVAGVGAIVTDAAALPWVGAAVAGVALQVGAWGSAWRSRAITRRAALVAAGGAAVMVLAVAALREMIRLSAADVAALEARVAEAAEAGGAVVFFVFLVLNAGVIAWCLRLVRRHLVRAKE